MTKRTGTWLKIVLGLMLSYPATAPAAFHLVVIEEVFFGTEDCPNAQYVKLRTLEFAQILVTNQRVTVQLADGTEAADFGRFTRNLTHPEAGVAMIIGTSEAAGLFNMTFDEVVTGSLVQPDGRVCFGFVRAPPAPVDCVAYGNYTGPNPNNGAPAVAPQLGMALVRNSETHNNAADFSLGVPMPENNNGEVGTLGQCPPAPTATVPPEPTATVTAGIEPCTGDCTGDFMVTVDEIVHGVSAALGESTLAGCERFDADGSGTATVDEIVAAVDNALNGCG